MPTFYGIGGRAMRVRAAAMLLYAALMRWHLLARFGGQANLKDEVSRLRREGKEAPEGLQNCRGSPAADATPVDW